MELDTLSDQQEKLMKMLEDYLAATHLEAQRTQTSELRQKLDEVEHQLKDLVRQLKQSH